MRWVSHDWCVPANAWILVVVVWISRLPLVLAGIGFDKDSWLFLSLCLKWGYTGEYEPTRSPGYFLSEGLATLLLLLSGGSHIPLALLNTTAFALSVFFFARILALLNWHQRNLLLWTYAFLPLNWVMSSDVMVEYSLWLLWALWSWYLALKEQYGWAGLAYGMAIASRPSQGVLLLLVFAFYWWYQLRWQLFKPLLGAVIIAIVLWIAPVLALEANPSVFFTHISNVILETGVLNKETLLLYLRSVLSASLPYLGLIPTGVGGIGLIYSLITLVCSKEKVAESLFSAGLVVVGIAQFLYAPHKQNYLSILTPFMLLLLACCRRPRFVFTICLLLLSHGFLGFPTHRIDRNTGLFYPSFRLQTGYLFADYEKRLIFPVWIDTLIQQAPPQSVILTGHAETWAVNYMLIVSQKRWVAISPVLEQVRFPNYAYITQKDTYFIIALLVKSEALRVFQLGGYHIFHTANGEKEMSVNITDWQLSDFNSELVSVRLR